MPPIGVSCITSSEVSGPLTVRGPVGLEAPSFLKNHLVLELSAALSDGTWCSSLKFLCGESPLEDFRFLFGDLGRSVAAARHKKVRPFNSDLCCCMLCLAGWIVFDNFWLWSIFLLSSKTLGIRFIFLLFISFKRRSFGLIRESSHESGHQS